MVDKGLLKRMQFLWLSPARCQSFDRENLLAGRSPGRIDTGTNRAAVQKNHAGAALSITAPYLCACQPQMVPYQICQRAAWIKIEVMFDTIDS
jgi:hypothetical protein